MQTIFSSKHFGKFEVNWEDKGKKQHFKIKFLNTGTEKYARKDDILKGDVRDRYAISIAGVGYLGDCKISENRKAYSIWSKMLRRCYNTRATDYYRYGGLGVTVAKEWFCFTTFLKDLKSLDGWNEDLFNSNILQLDKDKKQRGIYINQKVYSKETCCWLTARENSQYLRDRIKFKAISPLGEEYICYNIKEFCNKFSNDKIRLTRSGVSGVFAGKLKHHKGWKFVRLIGLKDMNKQEFHLEINELNGGEPVIAGCGSNTANGEKLSFVRYANTVPS